MQIKKNYQGKRILITGGCGFIGSNLAIELVQQGAIVTIVDSMIPDFGGNLFNLQPIRKDVELSFTDIRDLHAMRYLVQDKEIIFNLAGQISHIDSMKNPFQDLEINTTSQLQLLEICKEYNPAVRIVLTSTRQVYGRPQYLPVDEQHPISPVDVNGINSWAGEQYHLLYQKVYQLPTVILRLTNTYGPRQLVKHTRQGFTGTFIRRAVEGNEIQLFGTGEQKRDFIYVADVVESLLIAGEHPDVVGQTYNLASSPPHSLKEFVEMLQEVTVFPFQLVPFPEEKKKIDIGDYYGSCERFTNITGWEAKTDLRQGLQKSVQYYQKFIEHYW